MNAIILCNTESRRLPKKVFLNISGKSMIEHLIDAVYGTFEKILVVADKRIEIEKAEIFQDIIKGVGPLGGLYTGLMYSDTFYNFVFAADAPFANLSLAQYMMRKCHGFDAVCIRIKGFIQPLFSIHSKRNISIIENMLKEGNLRLSSLYPLLNTYYIEEEEAKIFDPPLLSFFSINNEEDLKKAFSILSSKL